MTDALPEEVPLDRISIYKNDLTYVERKVNVQSLESEFMIHVPNSSADMVLNTFNTAVDGAQVRYAPLSNPQY